MSFTRRRARSPGSDRSGDRCAVWRPQPSDARGGRAITTDPLVIFKTRADARVAPKSELPPDQPARRKPLGLAPGGGSSEPAADEPAALVSGAPSVAAGLSAEALARPATMSDVATALDCAIAVNLDSDGLFRERIGDLRSQVSELKAALIEARHEVRELKLIQESLRISTRGESGRDGARGVPGRDGRDGVGIAGPRGERGERGLPAPRISAWEARPERFEVVPVFSAGERGPAIALLSLFQAYDAAVTDIEDRDIASAARASREAVEEEVANHWAR
jgi:hypothetical protein